MSLRIEMNHHDERGAGAPGQGVKQSLQRLYSPSRGADTGDNRIGAGRTFLINS
jgi:hypothetical protein